MNSAGGQIRWNNELLHREAIKSIISDDLGVKIKKFNPDIDQNTPENKKLEHKDFQKYKKEIELLPEEEVNSNEYEDIKIGKWIRESDFLFVHAPGENKTILFGD